MALAGDCLLNASTPIRDSSQYFAGSRKLTANHSLISHRDRFTLPFHTLR